MVPSQSVMVRLLLCYMMIAPIVARPLAVHMEKRHSSSRQMEDVQLSVADLQGNSGEELPENRGGITFYSSSNGISLWDNGEIPYIFDKNFDSDHKKKAKKAMDMWSEHTCITFRKMKNSELKTTRIMDFVKIQYGNVTNSYVGKKDRDYINRGQELNIKREQAEIPRLYLHELGHVIGFNHEHSRSDRDRYVRIHSDNIVSGVGHNFAKLDYVKTTPYDYYSIMHYGVKDYTTDKSKKTIEILNSAIDTSNVGTKRRLSKFDIAWANKLYSCEVTTKPPATQPPPKFYTQFKLELPHVPKTVPASGYVTTHKRFLKCSNISCDVKGTENVALFITKLTSTEGLRVGDEVLLSSHKSSVRRGNWILCDHDSCRSSQACLVHSHNTTSGKVNFAFNRQGCPNHVLKISSKFKKQNETIDNGSRIVLEYSNPRTTQEWMGCDTNGYCKRTECKRTNLTILRHTASASCNNQMDEFEAIFVS